MSDYTYEYDPTEHPEDSEDEEKNARARKVNEEIRDRNIRESQLMDALGLRREIAPTASQLRVRARSEMNGQVDGFEHNESGVDNGGHRI